MRYLIISLFLLLLAGCGDDSADLINAPHNSNPSTPVNLDGEPGAPHLGFGIGIEGGGYILHWSQIEDAQYYILKSSNDLAFSAPAYYYMEDNQILHANRDGMYYSVKAVLIGSETGWSNVVRAW